MKWAQFRKLTFKNSLYESVAPREREEPTKTTVDYSENIRDIYIYIYIYIRDIPGNIHGRGFNNYG